jgi:hypothetical protein
MLGNVPERGLPSRPPRAQASRVPWNSRSSTSVRAFGKPASLTITPADQTSTLMRATPTPSREYSIAIGVTTCKARGTQEPSQI